MRLTEILPMLVFSTVASGIGPGVLLLAGVTDVDLLGVLYVPSLLTGWATGWFALDRARGRAGSTLGAGHPT